MSLYKEGLAKVRPKGMTGGSAVFLFTEVDWSAVPARWAMTQATPCTLGPRHPELQKLLAESQSE